MGKHRGQQTCVHSRYGSTRSGRLSGTRDDGTTFYYYEWYCDNCGATVKRQFL